MKPKSQAIAAATIWVTICLFATLALAQQPDPAFLQSALNSIRAQRDAASDAAAIAEAKLALANTELEKAKTRIKELEPKPEPEK